MISHLNVESNPDVNIMRVISIIDGIRLAERLLYYLSCEEYLRVYKDIYACIINIYVPHEVKNLRALAKRTSRIMKYGQDVAIQKGQIYPKWEVVLGAPDRVKIPCLMHDTRLCKQDVKMTRLARN